jgi:hypothetical protein
LKIVVFFSVAIGTPGWPFIRCRFGTGAYYPFGYVAVVIMFCYSGFGDCPHAMAWFFVCWLGLVLFHRGCTLQRAWRGEHEHSLYDGTPWLVSMLFGLQPHQEVAAKLVAEPLLLLAAAGLVACFSQPLGLFVAAVAASTLLRAVLIQMIEMAFDRTQRDAEMTLRQRAKRRRRE